MQNIEVVAFRSYDLNSIKLKVPSSSYTATEILWLCDHCAIPSERPPTFGNSKCSIVKRCVDFPLYLTLS